MAALNFMPQWADAVAIGARHANNERFVVMDGTIPKRTTIRKVSDRYYPGVELQLYTGQRTKACRLLGTALCLSVTPFFCHPDFVRLGSQVLYVEQWERLARLDTAGLWSGDELRGFFARNYGLPFEGSLIGW